MKIKSTKGLHIEREKNCEIFLDLNLFFKIFIVLLKY